MTKNGGLGCGYHLSRLKPKTGSRRGLAKSLESDESLGEQTRRSRAPTHCIPCQLASLSTGQLTRYLSGQLANGSTEALQHSRDHAPAIFFAHAGAGREAKALLEETFADFAAVHFGGGDVIASLP